MLFWESERYLRNDNVEEKQEKMFEVAWQNQSYGETTKNKLIKHDNERERG